MCIITELLKLNKHVIQNIVGYKKTVTCDNRLVREFSARNSNCFKKITDLKNCFEILIFILILPSQYDAGYFVSLLKATHDTQ